MKKSLLLTYGIFLFLNSEVKIEDCTSIKSDKKRLACYDYLLTGKSQIMEKETPILINQDIKQNNQISDEKNFGLSKRQVEQNASFNSTVSLMSSILDVFDTNSGKTRFKLKNNQTWESQSPIPERKSSFRKKTDIIIQEANMGGFWMISKKNDRRIKVRRIS